MGRKWLATSIVLGVLACGAGYAQTRSRQTPANPDQGKVEAPRVTPGPDPNAAGLGIEPNTYIIGPLDLLYLKVFRDTDFTGQYLVRTDGKISLPLIGERQAAGLTPVNLAAEIKQALSDYIIQPDVTVMVYQVNSKSYVVAGEVNKPGKYPLLTETHIFDAINEAGGFKDFANKKDITIVRGAQRLKFNYEEVRKGKKLEQNIELQNGDAVLVR